MMQIEGPVEDDTLYIERLHWGAYRIRVYDSHMNMVGQLELSVRTAGALADLIKETIHKRP